MRLFLGAILCLFISTNKTLASEPKINVEGAIERFLNGLGEYYEAGGIEAVKRSFQIDEGEVKVPRVGICYCQMGYGVTYMWSVAKLARIYTKNNSI